MSCSSRTSTSPLTLEEEIAILYAAVNGYADKVPIAADAPLRGGVPGLHEVPIPLRACRDPRHRRPGPGHRRRSGWCGGCSSRTTTPRRDRPSRRSRSGVIPMQKLLELRRRMKTVQTIKTVTGTLATVSAAKLSRTRERAERMHAVRGEAPRDTSSTSRHTWPAAAAVWRARRRCCALATETAARCWSSRVTAGCAGATTSPSNGSRSSSGTGA